MKTEVAQSGRMRFLTALISLWLISQLFFFDYMFPQVFWRALGGNRGPARILFAMIIIAFLIQVGRQNLRLLPLDKIDFCMIMFTVICTVSLFLGGADSEFTNRRWLTSLFNLAYFPFGIYFVIKSTPYTRAQMRTYFLVLCFIGFYLAITGICEFKAKYLVWPKYILQGDIGIHLGRARGPVGSAATMGRMLVVTFMSMLFINSLTKRRFLKLSLYLFATLATCSIYLTYTRGPWIGLAFALLISVLFKTGIRRPALLIILLCSLTAAVGATSKLSLFGEDDTLFSRRQSTITGRIAAWITTLKIVRANPIFGIGYGKFNSEFDNYYSEIEGWALSGFDGNHNTFLGILAEVGIVGFFFYAAIFCLLLKMCLEVYRQCDENHMFEKKLVVVTLATLGMYLLTGIVGDVRFHPSQNSAVFLLLGMVASIKAKTQARPKEVEY